MGGIRSKLWWLSWVGGAVLGSGCFSPPAGAVARLEQVKRDGAELEKASEGLEARLLGDQANLHLWQELRRRHGQVSAIVVRNHDGHYQDMVRLLVAQQEKARKLRRGTNVASADTYLSRAVATATLQKGAPKALRSAPRGR